MTLTAFPFYGGKSPKKARSAGRWIVRHLPRRRGYLEAFGGSLAILLNRPPVNREIVNDRDGRIANWWRCVREHPEALAHLCENSPPSSRCYESAVAALAAFRYDPETPSVHHAWALWMILRDSAIHAPEVQRFATFLTPDGGQPRTPDIARLNARMRKVVVENRDAVDLLERVEGYADFSTYIDPPYLSADTSPYGCLPDRTALADAMKRLRGAVVVSGYGDDWDCLDWPRRDFPSQFVSASGERSPRIERVWFRGFSPGGLFK